MKFQYVFILSRKSVNEIFCIGNCLWKHVLHFSNLCNTWVLLNKPANTANALILADHISNDKRLFNLQDSSGSLFLWQECQKRCLFSVREEKSGDICKMKAVIFSNTLSWQNSFNKKHSDFLSSQADQPGTATPSSCLDQQ